MSWRRQFCSFSGAAALLVGASAQAADLASRALVIPSDPFAPARPLGVASGLPRSPLADVTVFGTERFDDARDAQAHCPHDAVVRVDPFSTVYRRARPSDPGPLMCASSALSEGDLPP